ncbi:AzlC family ABC transporter permease [Streptomyces xanthophaeus]|uniref:AzlC family ABC transporter permease n=1 Tax=Streptomyces xanthophaeus TaxID=67385 RepID=UPI0034367076
MTDAVNEKTPGAAGAAASERADATENPPRTEFWAGARAMAPFMIAAFPMGIIAGAAGIAGGVGWLGTLGMAAAVNSGTAMLAGLQLLRDGSAWPIILLTTLVLSLRMMIYAIMLRPHLKDIPQRWRALLAFGLVDAVFFIVIERFKNPAGIRERQWYFLGCATAMFANWISSLALGMVLGSAVPGVAGEGLEFPMTALFIAMMAGALTNWKIWASVMAAGTLALVSHPLPYNLYVVVATLGGAVVGALCEAWEKRRKATAETPEAV